MYNVDFRIGIGNGYIGVEDTYFVSSYNNQTLYNNVCVGDIWWKLEDSSGTALSSDALPTTAPVLADWPFDWGLRIDGGIPDEYGKFIESFYIRAPVSSVELIPEPGTFYYVNAADGSDDNDGMSPETPFATIQKGIDSANDGDTVIVADGTYTGEGNRDIDFLGKAITVRSESGPENCIIDCNSTESEHHRGFVFQNNEYLNSVLEGFTITNGYAKYNGGGAIFCAHASSPTIKNCIITGNSTMKRGGGILAGGSNRIKPTISNCIITDNSAGYEGGGLSFGSGTSTVINCTFSGNWADYNGGAISYGQGNQTLINCTITGNSAGQKGGAIWSEGSSSTVTNSVLWDNEAPFGSQIYLETDIVDPHYYIGSDASVSYSDVQGGPNDVCVDTHSTLNWDLNNIDADPCFVDPGYWDVNGVWVEGDCRLLPTSPCVDAGDPNYIPEPNETDLDGNPRVTDGDEDGTTVVDMGAYEFWPPIEARMKLTPQALNCSSKGKYVKAHITLPEEILAEDIDGDAPAVAEPMDVESEYIKVFASGKGAFTVEIAFERAAFCEALTETGEIEVTVSAFLTTGREFYASDTITIKRPPMIRKSIKEAQTRRLRRNNKSISKGDKL